MFNTRFRYPSFQLPSIGIQEQTAQSAMRQLTNLFGDSAYKNPREIPVAIDVYRDLQPPGPHVHGGRGTRCTRAGIDKAHADR